MPTTALCIICLQTGNAYTPPGQVGSIKTQEVIHQYAKAEASHASKNKAWTFRSILMFMG